MKKILFVCTGNICRSSTAEALLRQKLEDLGMSSGFLIDSAGTHNYHVGNSSDDRAIKAAMKRNIDMFEIRARQIKPDDFKNFDFIIAMDQGHLRLLKNTAPNQHQGKISLFLDHSNQGLIDVPDPYYGDLNGFEDVLDILEEGMDGLINHVRK